jgi:hypothetical protein
MKTSRADQIASLIEKRNELHREMVAAPAAKLDGQWYADRVNEMAHLNKQLKRLQAIPADACV